MSGSHNCEYVICLLLFCSMWSHRNCLIFQRYFLFYCHDDEGNKHLRNAGQFLWDYMVQHSRRQVIFILKFSICLLFQHKMAHFQDKWKASMAECLMDRQETATVKQNVLKGASLSIWLGLILLYQCLPDGRVKVQNHLRRSIGQRYKFGYICILSISLSL